MRRIKPNILITGTPGTGKTTLAKKISENLQLKYMDIAEAIKKNELYDEYDAQMDTYVLDEDKLLDHLEEQFGSPEGGFIMDYHSSEFFPKRWFDFVFVLRCDTEQLFDRLTQRCYSERKRCENIECEIFGTAMEEAKESYDDEIVVELQNTFEEDLPKNITKMIQIVGEYSSRCK